MYFGGCEKGKEKEGKKLSSHQKRLGLNFQVGTRYIIIEFHGWKGHQRERTAAREPRSLMPSGMTLGRGSALMKNNRYL